MNFHIERHTAGFEKAPRASRACELCHSRKVKCDVSATKPRCTNCQHDDQVCKPRMRKRRTHPYQTKPSPRHNTGQHDAAKAADASNRIPGTNLHSTHNTAAASIDPGLFLQKEASQVFQPSIQDDTQQEPNPSPLSTSASSVPSSYHSGHMERSTYIAPDEFRGEDCSEVDYVLPMPCEVTQQIAKFQNAFEIPPRAIRDSLFDKFWSYCYSWDPIVDRSQVVGVAPARLSPLLLQSIFLAGSRMQSPSQPHTFASAQEYYTRAKTLFWLDYEKDPMTLLIATSLMHWWNPHGPERVSTNTSSFWCKITVSLAQQMGLHRTKKPVPDESLRRRLWWSIVVSTLPSSPFDSLYQDIS